MWMKTAVRRLEPLLPQCIEMRRAAALEEQLEAGQSQTFDYDFSGAVDGEVNEPAERTGNLRERAKNAKAANALPPQPPTDPEQEARPDVESPPEPAAEGPAEDVMPRWESLIIMLSEVADCDVKAAQDRLNRWSIAAFKKPLDQLSAKTLNAVEAAIRRGDVTVQSAGNA